MNFCYVSMNQFCTYYIPFASDDVQLFESLCCFYVFPYQRIGTNYLFLAGTPGVSTPLDALGEGVWYYVSLELFCFGIFLGIYGLYRFITVLRKWNKRSGLKEEKYHYL